MKISVLINNYNYGNYLDECLSSVFAQTLQAHEIIVVDDGSTDDSVEKLKPYCAHIKLIQQSNQGQAAAMATATLAATGDLFCYLDSDDKWRPAHLKRIYTAFQRPEAPDMVYTNLESFDQASGLHGTSDVILTQDTFIPTSQQLAFCRIFVGAPTSAIAIKASYARSLFAPKHIHQLIATCGKVNGDEILIYGSSLIGCAKLALAEPTASYRIHGQNNYFGIRQSLQDKQRKERIIRLIAEQHSVRRCMRSLQAELIKNSPHLPHTHTYKRGYLKAPRRLGLTGIRKYYWKFRLKQTYTKYASHT